MSSYLNPALAVDACVRHGDDILLVQRKFHPAGSWVLPGGFVGRAETKKQIVIGEEAGLGEVRLLMVMGGPQRSRKHIVSIVYEVDAEGEPREAMMHKMLASDKFQTFEATCPCKRC